jgi:hypothetical protein
MRPASRYNTGLGLKKTEVDREGEPAISARCISSTSTSINRDRCVTLLDISVIVRDMCWISIGLKLPLPLADCMLTSREPEAVGDPIHCIFILHITILSHLQKTDNFYG